MTYSQSSKRPTGNFILRKMSKTSVSSKSRKYSSILPPKLANPSILNCPKLVYKAIRSRSGFSTKATRKNRTKTTHQSITDTKSTKEAITTNTANQYPNSEQSMKTRSKKKTTQLSIHTMPASNYKHKRGYPKLK